MTAQERIDLLKALAHPVRDRLLDSLASGEKSVGEVEEDTGISQPGLSQQLAILRKAGLVTTRRQAKMIFYSLEREVLEQLAASLSHLAGSPSRPRRASRLPLAGSAHFARVGRL